MRLKINRYEFDVSNKDWILDNGFCYQCMTLTHYDRNASWISSHKQCATQMSKKQFNQLVKEGKLIDYTEDFRKAYPNIYIGCKVWKFNVK